MNFILLHQPPHGWVSFPHPKAGWAPKRIKKNNWSFDVFWIHVSSSFQGSVFHFQVPIPFVMVSWHIGLSSFNSTQALGFGSAARNSEGCHLADGGYDGNGQIYGFRNHGFPSIRPTMKPLLSEGGYLWGVGWLVSHKRWKHRTKKKGWILGSWS